MNDELEKPKEIFFRYYAGDNFENLLKCLKSELANGKRQRLFDLIFGESLIEVFSSELQNVSNQYKLFQPNKSQIELSDTYFNSLKVKDKSPSELDIETLIDVQDMLKEGESITEVNKQFLPLYLKLLDELLITFDFECSSPEITVQDKNSPFIKSLCKRINKALKLDKKPGGNRLQRKAKCSEKIKVEVAEYSEVLETININSLLLELAKTKSNINSDSSISCELKERAKREIQSCIEGVSSVSFRKKTSLNFLVDKLKSIQIRLYGYSDERKKLIQEFISNMSELNNSVKKCNSIKSDDKKSSKDKAIAIISLKKQVKETALKQHSLVALMKAL